MDIQFKAKPTPIDKVKTQLLVLLVTKENWKKEISQLDSQLKNKLVKELEAEAFAGKEGAKALVPTFGIMPADKLLIVGLGDKDAVNLAQVRKAAAEAVGVVKKMKRETVAVDITGMVWKKISASESAQSVVEGFILGSYSFEKYKQTSSSSTPKSVSVELLYKPSRLNHATNGINLGKIMADATLYARDLVNESPTVTTPTFLAKEAQKLKKRGLITVSVLEEKDVRKLGMHAFLSVSRGSDEPPKFIKLTYKGNTKKIVVAGKAITFDTGGLSLKDAKNMETMKLDMAGAAAVLGVFKALAKLKPKVTVVGLIAACENMPGPKATKPGDVVTAMNGKSIEILNTDAEGRMTLADVLTFAVKEKPEAVIDMATLTGACMVALGEEIAGLFSNTDNIKEGLKKAARQAGELVWELPLPKEYKDNIKSDIAVLRNIGKSRYGGAIAAALFLQEFVDETPWVHLDIAGPAFQEKSASLTPKGGTGFGVRTVLNYLVNYVT